MNATDIELRLRGAWGEETTVRARRPSLYQVSVPAYLSDGDAAFVFVIPQDGKVRITDLGKTAQRLSYTRKLTGEVETALASLAHRNRLEFRDWRLEVVLPPDELLAGTLALVQAQSAAEASIASTLRAAAGAKRFKVLVQDAIREAFGDRAHLGYADANREYSLDAVVEGPRGVVGVAAVPSDIEAERAVAAKLKLEPVLVKEFTSLRHWVVLPRELEKLSDATRRRLVREYIPVVLNFEADRGIALERIERMAA